MNTIMIMHTDVGEFPMPPEMESRFRAANIRKNGRVDRRYKEGKELSAWERKFCDDKLTEWLAR